LTTTITDLDDVKALDPFFRMFGRSGRVATGKSQYFASDAMYWPEVDDIVDPVLHV
jgi:hypothetical protein